MDASLLAQMGQRGAPLRLRQLAEIQRDGAGFFSQLIKQRVKRAATQVEPRFKSLFDAHVEPGVDTLGDELHGYRVDQHARKHRHHAEDRHETEFEA